MEGWVNFISGSERGEEERGKRAVRRFGLVSITTKVGKNKKTEKTQNGWEKEGRKEGGRTLTGTMDGVSVCFEGKDRQTGCIYFYINSFT